MRKTASLILMLVVIGISSQACYSEKKQPVLRFPSLNDYAIQKGQELALLDKQTESVSVIMLGDSQFEYMDTGFIPYKTLNFGISGDTAWAVYLRAKKYKSVAKAKVIGLSVGTNDAALRVSPEDTLAHVNKIVTFLGPEKKILLGLINPLLGPGKHDSINSTIEKINALYVQEFSDHPHVALVAPMISITKSPYLADGTYYQNDGIHFSEYGYSLWNNNWLTAINKAMNN